MCSELVDLNRLAKEPVTAQVLEAKAFTPNTSAQWIDQIGTGAGEAAKRQTRDRDDEAAVGGMRSPHKSIANLKGVETCSKWRGTRIDQVIAETLGTVEAICTLGEQTMQPLLVDAARRIREVVCAGLAIAPWASEGLQGQLIHELIAMLEGPDVPVRTWLAWESVHRCIHKVIELGGVFPQASNKNADALLDVSFHVDKYSTSEPYKEGAEEIRRREIEASWCESVATSEELERRYGTMTYSRIGVVAKQKFRGLKLRLIHDVRRSGVNARVRLSERIVLPRLNDARNEILDHIE